MITDYRIEESNIIFLQIDSSQRVKILKFTRSPFSFHSPSPSHNIDHFNIPTIDATMQDNNNSTNLTNGDSRAVDRYANIRAAEEKKLLARKSVNNNKHV